jgi:exopolyphosphatase / guanosine-5'-triphosphate,3'-diphosphate pyrophosphatase
MSPDDPPGPPRERLGIVDLGSNTARLVVYRYRRGVRYRMEDEIREPLRLGEGLSASGTLSPAAVERALAALHLYHDYARATGLPTLQVIATSAVRDAGDPSAFLRRLADLDLDVEVLSGVDEARLGVLAIANSFAVDDAWVMDLGGGSAQVSRMIGRRFESGRSVPLGAVRLTEAHLKKDPPRPKHVRKLEDTIALHLGDLAETMAQDDLPLIAMGGTIRNLAKAVQKQDDGYPLDLLHGYFLPRDDFEDLVEDLLDRNARKRAQVRGIHVDRADIILAGALVYRWVLRHGRRDGIRISGQGVREGRFYRAFLPEPHRIEDVRRFSVDNLFRRFPQPEVHTDRVVSLSRTLFEELLPLHGYGDPERQLLWAAARLHDIGTVMNYYDHHKHGEYLVGAAAMPGWSHREQALVALLVRYHRKGNPKPGSYRPVLTADDTRRLRVLTCCLRLAEKLERSRAGRVEGVGAEIHPDAVTLQLAASEPPQVELWEAGKQGPLFEKTFGRPLRLVTVAPLAAARGELCAWP